jgi:hypothetical protein
LPWLVKEKGYIFEIKEDGTVEEKSGVTISKSRLKLLVGGEYKLTASKTEDVKGEKITWSSNNTSAVTVTQDGIVRAVGSVGDKAIITVEIGGHKDTCEVTIVSKVTGISAEPIEVAVGGTKGIVVKTTPAENVEDITYSYSSGDTNKVTVDAKTGKVTGVSSTATPVSVTITGTNGEGEPVTAICQVTVKVNIKDNPTAEDIAKNPEIYYGKVVTNYTAGGATYRIFFVDEAGKYGEKNTVYLKADFETNKTITLNDYANYKPATTKVKTMNLGWANNRGNNESAWNENEKAAAWLCTPEEGGNEGLPWSSYYDGNKANYVIGGPSVEMFVDSYNNVSHPGVTNYTLGVKYRATNVPGYIYTINGGSTGANNEYSTGINSVDYKNYGSMYCGKNGAKGEYYWWLASPSSFSNVAMGHVRGNNAYLFARDYKTTQGISPLVSLRSDFTVQIER